LAAIRLGHGGQQKRQHSSLKLEHRRLIISEIVCARGARCVWRSRSNKEALRRIAITSKQASMFRGTESPLLFVRAMMMMSQNIYNVACDFERPLITHTLLFIIVNVIINFKYKELLLAL
jgi:hypothetical protein